MYNEYPLARAGGSDDDDDDDLEIVEVLKGGGFSPTSELSLVTELPSTYLRASRVRPVVRIRGDDENDDEIERTVSTPEPPHTYGATPPSLDRNTSRTRRRRGWSSTSDAEDVPYILHRAPDTTVQRSERYMSMLATQKERYWRITPTSVEFLVERSLGFIGTLRSRSTSMTVARHLLWKHFTLLLDTKRVSERKQRAARLLSDQTPVTRALSASQEPSDEANEDGFSRWSRVKPRNMAESIVLDRLKQIFKCSTLKRENESSPRGTAATSTRDQHHQSRKKAKKAKHSTSSPSRPAFFTASSAPSYASQGHHSVEKSKPVDPRRRLVMPSAPAAAPAASPSRPGQPPMDPRRRVQHPAPLKGDLLPSKSSRACRESTGKQRSTADHDDYMVAVSPSKPRKRARTDPSMRHLYNQPSSAPCPVAAPTSHVTGATASLPENWKWRQLAQDIKPIRPFDGMSVEQIEDHLRSIKVEGRLNRFRRFGALLQKLMDHPRNCNGVFNSPVDPVEMNLPTYTTIIRHPMDLGTVKARLDKALYDTPEALAADIRLVFKNAMTFNNRNHWVHVNADTLLSHFDENWSLEHDKLLLEESKAVAHSCDVCLGHTCAACDQRCLELVVPFNQCFGNCGTTFRKGSTYFVTRDGTRMWCTKCRTKSMKEERILQEDDECFQNPLVSRRNTLPTASEVSAWLIKRKCEVGVEPWVRCSCCAQWMHQVCVFFNPVEDAYDTDNKFVCPHCQLKSRRLASIPPSFLDCTSLPESELSRFLEASLGEAAGDAIDSLCVRTMTFTGQVSHLPTDVVDMFQQNARTVRQHFGSSPDVVDVPDKLVHGTKTIYLFQKHHGVDVCLFAMYVQEYDDAVEYAPNRRSVYLAYIDSVRYMEPASIRTAVYHTILTSYFDYVRRQGMERVYIWSCPPQRSQSYVFWCHPHFQKTPGVDHLRSWYKRVLDKAKDRGIIASYGTLYDRHFAEFAAQLKKDAAKGDTIGGAALGHAKAVAVATRRGSSTTLLEKDNYLWPVANMPLFEGDFIPGELDRVARALKAKNKPRREKEPPSDIPIYLKDAFAAFVTAIKAIRDDLLQVDLQPPPAGTPLPAKDPPTKLPPFVGSRFAFHQMSSHASYQFDSLRRAKHSTMMLLHQMINASVPQCNTFCHECALLITHADHWFCRTCAHFSLCDWCHAHHGPDHPHKLYRGLDDVEGS